MSRIGKKPIQVPAGVKVAIREGALEIESKKSKLTSPIPPGIRFEIDGSQLVAYRDSEEKPYPAYHGLARALAASAIRGVSEGFSKELDIVGIGYKVDAKPKAVTLTLGYSHPIEYPLPLGIEATVDAKQTKLSVTGIDRQKVGQVAAEMRSLRPPDPYKNKGVRYAGERLKKKVGKTGAK